MTNDIEACRKQAKEALAGGKYVEAREIYEEALAAHNESPELHYGMGTVCFLLGDLEVSADHFKEMIRLAPLQGLAYINLGAIYNRLGQYDESIKTLKHGIRLDPHRAEGYYNLGLAYKNSGNLDMALEAYREALRLNPRMYEAHLNMGNIYRDKNSLSQAMARYHQALEVRPNCDKARSALEGIEAELALQQRPIPAIVPTVAAAPQPSSKQNPNHPIAALHHAETMRDLHRLVIELEGGGQSMLDVVKNQVEAAIRELSISMLTPNDPRYKIDDQLQIFDDAASKLREAQQSLQQQLSRAKGYCDIILD